MDRKLLFAGRECVTRYVETGCTVLLSNLPSGALDLDLWRPNLEGRRSAEICRVSRDRSCGFAFKSGSSRDYRDSLGELLVHIDCYRGIEP